MSTSSIGKPIDRVDGRLKVTGGARYSAEADVEGTAYAVLVQSTIARGTIEALDTREAQAAPGVLAIITPRNLAEFAILEHPKNNVFTGGVFAEYRLPLSDMNVYYAGQHIAVVVADTIERAQFAASLLRVKYTQQPPRFGLDDPRAEISKPGQFFGQDLQACRGDVDAAIKAGGDDLVVVRQAYTTPIEHHNPIEPSATTAVWDGDSLTVYDATQFNLGTQAVLAEALAIPREKVRVICPFIGGGFGCKGFQWPHTILAAVAAKAVGRPVKLALTRPQMFTSSGHRPPLLQDLVLAATKDGRLVALRHDTTMHCSTVGNPNEFFGEYVEACGLGTSQLLYACPNVEISHTLKKIEVAAATSMRAPGEAPGTFALESALDEMAYALAIDPVQLRLINHADVHPQTLMPWSSKHLKECYQLGAEKFGWKDRNPKPRSMRNDDGRLVGWGVATATYPGYRFPAAARIRLLADGDGDVRAIGSSATHDLGTGAFTVFTQITATLLDLPPENVIFQLGDSSLPYAPVAGGSNSTASVGHALTLAAAALKAALVRVAGTMGDSPLRGLSPAQLVFSGGKLAAKDDPTRAVSLAELVSRSGQEAVEGFASPPGFGSPHQQASPSEPEGPDYDAEQAQFAFQSFGCHFAEVKVDEPLAQIRVTRIVSVMDIGRVMNPKTSRSQIMGGVIMGLGMALMEATEYDPRTARPVTDNLADYALPVHADINIIEPYFVDIPDPHINALGCRGIGEIGITGVAAAIANAVYHATGNRVRDLPILPERLLN